MSTFATDAGILTYLERLTIELEVSTSAQTTALMELTRSGYDTREAEEALWQSVDNLLALRRQQMYAREMLIGWL